MAERFLRDSLLSILIVLGLVLGGASAAGIWANAALQLLALAVIALMLAANRLPRIPGWLGWLTLAALALPLVQLIPLPPPVWTALPGRSTIAAGFGLAGQPLPWLPLSLDADATLGTWTAMLPAFAVLLATLVASPQGQTRAAVSVIAIAAASVLLAIVQQSGGEGMALVPYAKTNPGTAVGLFANRNHFATLLLMAMPLVAAIGRITTRRGAGVAGLAMLSLGIVAAGSDAGIGLGLIVLPLSLAGMGNGWPRKRVRFGLALGGAAALAATGLAVWQYRAGPPPGGSEQHRPVMILTTLEAALDHFPAGSGGGSFQRIYARYEDPAQASGEYRNHAHSDYAEVLLEYGLPGGLLMLGVLGWWLLRARAVWPRLGGDPLLRAAAVIPGIAFAHSLVDYPLRTAALAMLFAYAAGLLASPHRREIQAPNRRPPSDREGIRVTL